MSNSPDKRPVVVGLYGISGCGKTFLLHQLKKAFHQEYYAFYEGSEVLDNVVPGGLDSFKQLDKDDQIFYRELAIRKIGEECVVNHRVGVVTGHFMFWLTDDAGEQVITTADLATYTHILYLDVPIDSVVRNRATDKSRTRPPISQTHLQEWQEREKHGLRRLCSEHRVLFSLVSGSSDLSLEKRVSALLEDFRHHSPELSLTRAKRMMDDTFMDRKHQLQTVFVMDADRTLIAEDTGQLFWKIAHRTRNLDYYGSENPLKTVFSGPMGYSYAAFRQVALLYEELAQDLDFDLLCREVVRQVTVYPEFVLLLQKAAKKHHVGAVVITCGLRCLWEMIIEKAGLSETVKVIGGGRLADGFVVTAEVKADLVDHLHSVYNVHVSAFGDGPLDLPMLIKADTAIVVVGEEAQRSRSMDELLLNAINNGLQARQTLLAGGSSPRLDITILPLLHLADQTAIESLLERPPLRKTPICRLRLLHTTDRPSAKVLMTSTRDASVAGPALRDAHFRIGQYLATELVTEIVGLEQYPIPHVQGHQTAGHRLRNEARTTIVAILRGGEPMAFGVSAAFPLAMFVHARKPEDIQIHHIREQSNIILVDSVVNNGKTVVEFWEYLKMFHDTLEQVVVVAGVVHTSAVSDHGPIAKAVSEAGKLSVVALRLSTNKFTGKGVTDTGNRLFNTTHVK